MRTFEVAKQALRLAATRPSLWLFGIFVAGGAGGGGGGGPPPGEGHPMPGWVWALLAAGAVLGLIGLAMHVVSEGALIEAARRERLGRRLTVREGFRVGAKHAWRMLGVKAVLGGASLGAGALVALPILATVLGGAPWWASALGAAGAALVALPALLTLWLVVTWAERFVVIDGHGVRDALRAGRLFLARRLGPSLELAVAWFVGPIAIGAAAAPLVGLAALLGLGGWLVGGLWAAIAAAAVLLVPVGLAVSGVTGTYRSSVWTLGFLAEREGA